VSFDFDAAVASPFRMQPGLRRLTPASAPQLTPAVVPHRGVARHLREKLAVLWAFRDQALLCMPGFDPDPALAALAAHAAADHPQAFSITPDPAASSGQAGSAPGAQPDSWHAHWLGWRLDGDDQPHDHASGWPEIGTLLRALPRPWRRTALLMLAFAEDLAIVDARSGTLPWLAVALPSMWAPEHKIGRHFTEVHAPVADNRLVIGAAEHLMKLVTGPDRWERFVWTLTGHPRLHAHPQRLPAQRWPADLSLSTLAAQTWWRTERQTFLPVPGLAQAVFTIQVQTTPLATAIDNPQKARQLHGALASMSDAVLAYRGLAEVRPLLLAWLAQRAQAAEAEAAPAAMPPAPRGAAPPRD